MALSTEYTDPSILAFLRASGMSQETAAADVARRRTAIEQALGTSIKDLEDQGEVSRENISGNAESNGVFRSGQLSTDLQRQRASQLRRQGALTDQAGYQIGNLTSSLQQQIAENQQKAAELGLAGSQNADIATGKAGIDTKYGNLYGTSDGTDDTSG